MFTVIVVRQEIYYKDDLKTWTKECRKSPLEPLTLSPGSVDHCTASVVVALKAGVNQLQGFRNSRILQWHLHFRCTFIIEPSSSSPPFIRVAHYHFSHLRRWHAGRSLPDEGGCRSRVLFGLGIHISLLLSFCRQYRCLEMRLPVRRRQVVSDRQRIGEERIKETVCTFTSPSLHLLSKSGLAGACTHMDETAHASKAQLDVSLLHSSPVKWCVQTLQQLSSCVFSSSSWMPRCISFLYSGAMQWAWSVTRQTSMQYLRDSEITVTRLCGAP